MEGTATTSLCSAVGLRRAGDGDYSAYVASAAAAKYLLDFERADGRTDADADACKARPARGRGRTGRLSFGRGYWKRSVHCGASTQTQSFVLFSFIGSGHQLGNISSCSISPNLGVTCQK